VAAPASTAKAARLRLRFFGTSNLRAGEAPERVMPEARAIGVADLCSEVAPRIDYLDAIAVQKAAGALLLLGSSEPHYTASRLFPALLAGRPIIAAYHRSSTVCTMLRAVAPGAALIAYDERAPAGAQVEAIARALAAAVDGKLDGARDLAAIEPWSASRLAGKLAALLDEVIAARDHAASDRRARPARPATPDGGEA
jgi:hypothetical protein